MTANRTTRFCLIRHGETDWNAERRLQGQTDIPLNANGQEQAQTLAAALKLAGHHFDVLYSSDLQRASGTAAPVAQALAMDVIPLPALRERHFGQLQGVRLDEAASLKPEVWHAYDKRLLEHDLGGGESIAGFAQRVRETVQELAARHAGKTVMLVAHGGVLDAIYRIASGQPLHEKRMVPVPNASLNWLAYNGDSWQVEHWADTRHLSDTLDEL